MCEEDDRKSLWIDFDQIHEISEWIAYRTKKIRLTSASDLDCILDSDHPGLRYMMYSVPF